MEIRIAVTVGLFVIQALWVTTQGHSMALQYAVNDYKLMKMQFIYDLKEAVRYLRGLKVFVQPVYSYGLGPLYPLPYRKFFNSYRYRDNYRKPLRVPFKDDYGERPYLKPYVVPYKEPYTDPYGYY